jgi:hypothetical protein
VLVIVVTRMDHEGPGGPEDDKEIDMQMSNITELLCQVQRALDALKDAVSIAKNRGSVSVNPDKGRDGHLEQAQDNEVIEYYYAVDVTQVVSRVAIDKWPEGRCAIDGTGGISCRVCVLRRKARFLGHFGCVHCVRGGLRGAVVDESETVYVENDESCLVIMDQDHVATQRVTLCEMCVFDIGEKKAEYKRQNDELGLAGAQEVYCIASSAISGEEPLRLMLYVLEDDVHKAVLRQLCCGRDVAYVGKVKFQVEQNVHPSADSVDE